MSTIVLSLVPLIACGLDAAAEVESSVEECERASVRLLVRVISFAFKPSRSPQLGSPPARLASVPLPR